MDQDLKTEIALLHHEPVQALANVGCMIVGQAGYGNQNIIHRSCNLPGERALRLGRDTDHLQIETLFF